MGFIACNYLIPLQHFNPLCFHILNILNGKMSIHVADICTTLYHSFKLGQVGPLIQHFRFYSFLLIYSVIAHPCNKKTASIDARSALLQFFSVLFSVDIYLDQPKEFIRFILFNFHSISRKQIFILTPF